MRPSDRAREIILELLRRGHAEGRLSTSTLERRIERALVAETEDDLVGLTVDITHFSRRHGSRQRLTCARDPPPVGPCLELSRVGERPLVIGRGRGADVALDADLTVSRRHAQILRVDGRFVLTDLGSTNGTFLDDRLVQQVEVFVGDIVVLGEASLRLK